LSKKVSVRRADPKQAKINDRGVAAVAYNVLLREGVTLGVGASFDTQKLDQATHKVCSLPRSFGAINTDFHRSAPASPSSRKLPAPGREGMDSALSAGCWSDLGLVSRKDDDSAASVSVTGLERAISGHECCAVYYKPYLGNADG